MVAPAHVVGARAAGHAPPARLVGAVRAVRRRAHRPLPRLPVAPRQGGARLSTC